MSEMFIKINSYNCTNDVGIILFLVVESVERIHCMYIYCINWLTTWLTYEELMNSFTR